MTSSTIRRWRVLGMIALIGSGIMALRPTVGADGAPTVVLLAVVDGKPVFNLDVDHALAALSAAAPAAEKGDTALRAVVLNQLVDRRIVLAALERAHAAATADEIDLEVSHLETELARTKQTLDQFLAKTGQTESMLRADLAWRLTWQKYLDQHANGEALEAFFKVHHRDFDGAELRLSHILLRPIVAGDEAAVLALFKQAERIRRQIQTGEIKFAAAAEKHSAGPSRQQGGDLGWIPRHGVMVEPFAHAAFALEKGEISPPVATVFGIHLITVTDMRPGEKTLADVQDAVRSALAQQLYEELAARERPKAKIEFTGRGPYFKPGTTELVAPAAK